MATTIKQTEALPASYPNVVGFNRLGLFTDEDVVTNEWQIWQRIEAYTAYRWTARTVVWIVEGAGDWTPPLTPATLTGVEVWDGTGWEEAFPSPSPFGGYLLATVGPYRITATVGGGDVPAAVAEAFKRLHEYTRGINDSFKNETAHNEGVVTGWTGKAIQLSGAADLLRPYRKA